MSDALDRELGRLPAGDHRAADAAARRFTERALEDGLLDLAYAHVPSPLGDLLVAGTRRGLVRLSYAEDGTEKVLERLAASVSPRIMEAPARLDDSRRQLEEYFAGRRRDFEMPLDWTLTRGFGRRVLQATARIPFGGSGTYTTIAGAAGSPRAMRATGNALGANPMPIVVPCHRVLRHGGGLGGYTGGLHRKRFLLQLEGLLPAEL